MSGRPRDDRDASQAPGPGQYAPSDATLRDKSPAFTMRPKTAGPRVGRDGPGPGEYYPPASTNGPAFSMRGRPKDHPSSASTPGVGAYDSSGPSSQGPAFSLRGRPHDPPSRFAGPSPQEYGPGADLRSKRPPAWSFGASSRPALSRSGEGPGPGQYTLSDDEAHRRGRGPTLSGRPKSADVRNKSPGPAYLPSDETVRKRVTGGVMSGRPRDDRDSSQAPGPGQYAPSDATLRDKSPAFTMRPRTATSRPAADSGQLYLLPSPTGPAYTFGMRWKDTSSEDATPGPADYGRILST
jgi:hypothetical protein